jgi:hypothetical protein
VDGRWFCDKGNARVDDSDSNVLEAYGTDEVEDCIIRRGFRGDKYVATFKFTWNANTGPGWVVRWLSPGDYLALAISAGGGGGPPRSRSHGGRLTIPRRIALDGEFRSCSPAGRAGY